MYSHGPLAVLQPGIAEIATVQCRGSQAGHAGGVTGGVSADRGVCSGDVHMVAGRDLIRHAGLCDAGMAQRPVTRRAH